MKPIFLICLFLGFSASANAADEAMVPVSIPSEFQTVLTRTAVPVVYSETTGVQVHGVVKDIIAPACQTLKDLGINHLTPVFEPGDEVSDKVEGFNFMQPNRHASLSVVHRYQCVRENKPLKPVTSNCDCTYKRVPQYSLQIWTRRPGFTEHIKADLNRRTAIRRRSSGDSVLDPEKLGQFIKMMAPKVVGHEVLAGIPCTVHRQQFGDEGYIDRCVTEDLDKHLPPYLRFRALSEMHIKADGSIFFGRSTKKVVMNATVDSGIFNLPPGFQVLEQ